MLVLTPKGAYFKPITKGESWWHITDTHRCDNVTDMLEDGCQDNKKYIIDL